MKHVFVLLPLLLSAGPPAAKDIARAGMDAERLARIPVRMKSFVDRRTIAGSVTLVARNGAIAALDAAGYMDMESKKPLRADAIFQIHSMTKPVVGVAAMILVEEGRIALSDPVEKHIPEFRGLWLKSGTRPSRAITVRDVMTHTSGMIPNPPEPIKELHGALHMTLADVVAVYSQQPLDFEPGTKWQYSNSGIATLARIIEIVSGRPFEKFLEERIFQPLGMKDSYIYPPAAKYDRIPTAYLLKDGKTIKYTTDPLGEGAMKYRQGAKYPLPEGGIYSTAEDMYAFYQMMLDGGRPLLSRASVEVMTRNHTGMLSTNGPGHGYGLTFAVIRDAAGTLGLSSPGTFFHGGRYGTFAWGDPTQKLVGIFMIHREGGSDERLAFQVMANAAVLE